MNQKGQAIIEALAGAFGLILLIGSFAYVSLIGGSRLILENEVDRFVMCLASEKNNHCQVRSRQRLSWVTPWVKILGYQGHFAVGLKGYGVAEASLKAQYRFQTLTLNQNRSLEWSNIKIEIHRSFSEQEMRTGSHY